MKFTRIVLLLLLCAAPLHAWNKIAELPGPVHQLEMDAKHPGLLLGLTATRLYCSADGGHNWQAAGIPGGAGSIVVHPKDARIYALLDEKTTSGGSVLARKLWVSSDQCSTFQLVHNFNLVQDPLPLKLFADRYDAQMLFATDRDGRLLTSLNGGKTWRFLRVPENYRYSQIYASPINPDVLYISGYKPGNYISTEGGALFISKDRAKTWALLTRSQNGCVNTVFYEDPFFKRLLVSECDGTKTLSPATRTKSEVLRVQSIVSVPQNRADLLALQNVQAGVAMNLLISKNGGDTWRRFSSLAGTPNYLRVLNDNAMSVILVTRSGDVLREPLATFMK